MLSRLRFRLIVASIVLAIAIQAQAPTPAKQPEDKQHTYTNHDGQSVKSPQRSRSGIPAGASARCRDGSYSFSQHHSGTCSHHGGVAEWIR